MGRKFNDTGLCIPEKHFMADTSSKLAQIKRMVEDGAYFTINRPRQYGKTTIVYLLAQSLENGKDYLFIEMSFEGIGDAVFNSEPHFCTNFIEMLASELGRLNQRDLKAFIEEGKNAITNFSQLSEKISSLVKKTNKKLVLAIDEIDKSSNNQLFLSFLGMLREKYLKQSKSRDTSFQSVILAGVHDVKSLKLKISPDSHTQFNSPWNIAIDFNVDMSFSPQEIAFMLNQYNQERETNMDIHSIAERIYYYTSGYPYLVSKICKVVDEELLSNHKADNWNIEIIDHAFRYLVDEGYTTTLFDDIVKNLENNPALYDLVFEIGFNGKSVAFNILDPIINLGTLYGIFDNKDGRCKIHNRIFEQKIYGYMLSKQSRTSDILSGVVTSNFIKEDELNLKAILLGFQQFMKENYSTKDVKFLEREGRLLFLSYLKPIINGQGFDFKEPNVAEERRMDLVVTYKQKRYVVELKRWEGNAYHQKGLQQLSDYLDTYSLKKGYLLIFDFRKNKAFKSERIHFDDKEIFMVWV